MTAVEVFAPAKVNLTLHVTGQRDDGYHLLDSLVTFASIGDRLTFSHAEELTLAVTGPFAHDVPAGPDNLVLRAARLMGLTAAISLEKSLPVASGVGGGSADAAATLRGLARLHNVPLPDLAGQLSLGSDVPVCVRGGLVRLRGIGERLEPIGVEPLRWSLVLVNPGVPVSTPEVFRRLAGKRNPAMSDPFELGPKPDFEDAFPAWLARQRNDLERPAAEIAPVIGDVLEHLAAEPGCRLSRMSGSGATCFGLFGDRENARAAASRIALLRPEWWVAVSERQGL